MKKGQLGAEHGAHEYFFLFLREMIFLGSYLINMNNLVMSGYSTKNLGDFIRSIPVKIPSTEAVVAKVTAQSLVKKIPDLSNAGKVDELIQVKYTTPSNCMKVSFFSNKRYPLGFGG